MTVVAPPSDPAVLAVLDEALRTPISALRAQLDGLRTAYAGTETGRALQAVAADLDRYAVLLDDALALAAPPAPPSTVGRVGLAGLLDATLTTMGEAADARDVRFTFGVEGPVPRSIASDGSALRRALLVLLAAGVRDEAVTGMHLLVRRAGPALDWELQIATRADAPPLALEGTLPWHLAVRLAAQLNGTLDVVRRPGEMVVRLSHPRPAGDELELLLPRTSPRLVVVGGESGTAVADLLRQAGHEVRQAVHHDALLAALPGADAVVLTGGAPALAALESAAGRAGCALPPVLVAGPVPAIGADRPGVQWLAAPARPWALATALAHAVNARTGTTTPAAPAPLEVLVVDDNAVNLTVAAGLLKRRGHRVRTAASAAAALEAVHANAYDLILMDVNMPGTSGLDATRMIREHEGVLGRRHLIVALTARALAGDRARCLAAGMDDYLGKPLRGEDLDALLRRLPSLQERAPHEPAPRTPSVLPPMPSDAFARAIADLVLQHLPSQLEALRAALEAGDLVRVAAVAQAVEVACSNFEAADAVALALAIQLHARHQAAPAEIAALVDELAAAGSRLRQSLAELVPAPV